MLSMYVMAKTIRAENKELQEAELPRDHRKHCLNCRKHFNLLRRKIICSSCDEGFCKDCTQLWQILGEDTKRLCYYCVNTVYKQCMNQDCHLPSPSRPTSTSGSSDDLALTVESFYKKYSISNPNQSDIETEMTDNERSSDELERRSSIPMLEKDSK